MPRRNEKTIDSHERSGRSLQADRPRLGRWGLRWSLPHRPTLFSGWKTASGELTETALVAHVHGGGSPSITSES